MTRTQAADIARDLTNADYLAAPAKLANGTYIVLATSLNGQVDASAVASFASTRGVAAKVNEATFI